MDRYYIDFGLFQGFKAIKTARSYCSNGALRMFAPEYARFYEEYLIWHQSGTASLCALVAARMGLPPKDAQTAFQGALVHDVGKLFVPQEIVMKRGCLAGEEVVAMQTHADRGARFLKSRGFSDEVVRAVRHHHERWDGTGYPDGLSGEKIPLVARIIAVCDALDAMMAGRHYRSRMRPAKVFQEIQAGAGGQFDPEIAAVALGLIEEKGALVGVQNRA